MFVLATKSDVINFVHERSPHVAEVVVKEINHEVIITIKLTFFYWLFFSRSFHRYIDGQIQSRKMFGIDYKTIVTSI